MKDLIESISAFGKITPILTDEQLREAATIFFMMMENKPVDIPEELEPIMKPLQDSISTYLISKTIRRERAKKAGQASVKARAKKEAAKPKIDLEKRKINFIRNVQEKCEMTTPKDMIQNFVAYWTEHGDNDKKMRFEKQVSFNISRRMNTWKKRQKEFFPDNEQPPTIKWG